MLRDFARAAKWGLLTVHKRLSPPNYCFPSGVVHTNDPWTIANWEHLHRGIDTEERIKEVIKMVRPHTIATHDSLLATYRIAHHAASMGGCFVETGVFKGGASAVMAIAARDAGFTPHLHLFDSFQGLPEIKTVDHGMTTGAMSVDISYAEKAVFEIAKHPKDRTEFHVGWFQDTVPTSDTGPISLLRLDGDLYDSTLICLRDLFPRVIKGGFVIIDDYSLNGCRLACERYFRELGISPFLHYIDGIARYIVKD